MLLPTLQQRRTPAPCLVSPGSRAPRTWGLSRCGDAQSLPFLLTSLPHPQAPVLEHQEGSWLPPLESSDCAHKCKCRHCHPSWARKTAVASQAAVSVHPPTLRASPSAWHRTAVQLPFLNERVSELPARRGPGQPTSLRSVRLPKGGQGKPRACGNHQSRACYQRDRPAPGDHPGTKAGRLGRLVRAELTTEVLAKTQAGAARSCPWLPEWPGTQVWGVRQH